MSLSEAGLFELLTIQNAKRGEGLAINFSTVAIGEEVLGRTRPPSPSSTPAADPADASTAIFGWGVHLNIIDLFNPAAPAVLNAPHASFRPENEGKSVKV